MVDQNREGRVLSARQREWLVHVRRARASGESFRVYAEQRGLNVSQLYSWHSRLKTQGLLGELEPAGFVQVQSSCRAESPPREPGGTQRLSFPNGLTLEWQGTADVRLIAQLLRLRDPAQ